MHVPHLLAHLPVAKVERVRGISAVVAYTRMPMWKRMWACSLQQALPTH
jgi:hypothetical protein